MENNHSLKQLLARIDELRKDPLVSSNWVKKVAERTKKSEHTIKKYAAGIRNVPDGPIMVLTALQELIDEKREQISKLTGK